MDIKKVEKAIPFLSAFLKSNEFNGWQYEYLGMGNHLFVKNFLYGEFKEKAHGAIEDELYGSYIHVIFETMKNECEKRRNKTYNLNWSRQGLSSQKLGTFCEYYAKMSLASYGFSIYSPEVDDHGIDFVVETDKRFLKFQVKAARRATTGYVFARKETFKIEDNAMFMYLILLYDGEHPQSYIIPTAAWRENDGSKLFVDHANYDKPEWGINISDKNMHLLEQYRLDKIIPALL